MPKGVVSKVFEKDWGDGKSYSFKLQGDDTFFRLGKIQPQFREGESIQFDAVTKGTNTYVNEAPAPWVDGGAASAPGIPVSSQGNSGGSYKGSGKKPFGKSEEEKAYWKAREVRDVTVQQKIEIQAARNAAITTASFMWEKELVKTPAKQPDKYDAFLALVDQIADTYQRTTESKLVGADRSQADVAKTERQMDKAVATHDAKWED